MSIKSSFDPEWHLISIPLYSNDVAFPWQENKKVQVQVVVEQENAFGSRPGTSSWRISNRSLNEGFNNASPLNRRVSLGIQQLGSNNINSATQGISFVKEGRKAHVQKKFSRPSLVSQLRDETASVVSTFSGPVSPWYWSQSCRSSCLMRIHKQMSLEESRSQEKQRINSFVVTFYEKYLCIYVLTLYISHLSRTWKNNDCN